MGRAGTPGPDGGATRVLGRRAAVIGGPEGVRRFYDPQHWPDPERFDPGRFLGDRVEPDALVPQGGGDVATGHRCPGEAVTLTMIAEAARALIGVVGDLPDQDLGYDLSRIPTRPRSGVVIRGT